MNPEVKTKWIEALRSGEYKQGKEVLNNITQGTYCCLGVLCELYTKENPLETEVVCVDESYNECLAADSVARVKRYAKTVTVLPAQVRVWAGMENAAGGYGKRSKNLLHENHLTKDNDEGKTFVEIADIIEENF